MNQPTHASSKNSRPQQLNIRHDQEYQAVWAEISFTGRPSMNMDILNALAAAQDEIAALCRRNDETRSSDCLRYQVLSCATPGVFSLGGDLEYFLAAIRKQDRPALLRYATACIDILYKSACGYGSDLTTIALVQGEALGGGFEAALSCNVIIAERSATFGFPETLFGMFPGMGAYSLLARRITPAMAKRLIESGNVYSADELYELGVIDRVVADGEGTRAVHDLIRERRNRITGFRGLERAMAEVNPVSYEELSNIVNIWVDTALQLSNKNKRLMEYLLDVQNKRWDAAGEKAVTKLPRQAPDMSGGYARSAAA
ncbi:MAG: crotonase/enoyl-CoA hydratase family protein [Pseudomonadota bacterium]|nr:crotonase/enoyl-CoA hydratase family protein [Pseudomonadota bacterium]